MTRVKGVMERKGDGEVKQVEKAGDKRTFSYHTDKD